MRAPVNLVNMEPMRMSFELQRVAALCAVLAGLHAPLAQAQMIRDPALEALYTADRMQDLQHASAQRVQARSDDAPAVLGLALAALRGGAADLRLQAIGAAEACLVRTPRAAPCHYALGVTLGVQAMHEGLFKAARSAGTVRDALVAALEIDSAWYPARSALVEFYLLAPGIMGGSQSKVAELAAAAARPDEVQALQARVALARRHLADAVRGLAKLPASLEPALAADVHAWSLQAGLGLINEGRWEQALGLLERALRNRPRDAGALYAMGRARAEAGEAAQALKFYQEAAAAVHANDWPVHYRIGLTLEQLARPQEARAAYQRHLAAGKGPQALKEEARKRLEALGG